jgi:hypothetical protein
VRFGSVISTLLVLVGLADAQGIPAVKPSFSVATSATRAEVKIGTPIVLKLTMTNISDHDLRFSVRVLQCPPLISRWVEVRQVQVQLYDSEGNPVPLTLYGGVVQGRSGEYASRRAKVPLHGKGAREQGVGCGGGGTLGVLKPGESLTEDADLSKEFELRSPGRYTVYAQRWDEDRKAQVKSDRISLTVKP